VQRNTLINNKKVISIVVLRYWPTNSVWYKRVIRYGQGKLQCTFEKLSVVTESWRTIKVTDMSLLQGHKPGVLSRMKKEMPLDAVPCKIQLRSSPRLRSFDDTG
jgi:hypothetical protein